MTIPDNFFFHFSFCFFFFPVQRIYFLVETRYSTTSMDRSGLKAHSEYYLRVVGQGATVVQTGPITSGRVRYPSQPSAGQGS